MGGTVWDLCVFPKFAKISHNLFIAEMTDYFLKMAEICSHAQSISHILSSHQHNLLTRTDKYQVKGCTAQCPPPPFVHLSITGVRWQPFRDNPEEPTRHLLCASAQRSGRASIVTAIDLSRHEKRAIAAHKQLNTRRRQKNSTQVSFRSRSHGVSNPSLYAVQQKQLNCSDRYSPSFNRAILFSLVRLSHSGIILKGLINHHIFFTTW